MSRRGCVSQDPDALTDALKCAVQFVKLFRTLAGSPGLARFVEELSVSVPHLPLPLSCPLFQLYETFRVL